MREVVRQAVSVLGAVFAVVRQGVGFLFGPLFRALDRAPLWVRELAFIYLVWWSALLIVWLWVSTLSVVVGGVSR